jgi:hypothetical protein
MGGERDPRGSRSGDPGREARLAAALRENLRRRKAQSRGRAETSGPAGEPIDEPTDDTSGGGSAPDTTER